MSKDEGDSNIGITNGVNQNYLVFEKEVLP